MKHFFRNKEDGRFFRMFSPIHGVILCVFVLGIFLLYHYRDRIKIKCPYLGKILGLLLFLDQFTFYLWQFTSRYFNLRESLPLFHCRLAALILAVGLLFNLKPAQIIGVFWGLLGSVMALIFTDLYPFRYPHFTNFQFFHLHMIMGWSVAYILFTKDYKISKEWLKKVLLITAGYNAFLFLFNTVMLRITKLDFNYGFLRHLPLGLMKFFRWLPPPLFPLLVIVFFSLILFLIYQLISWIERKIS